MTTRIVYDQLTQTGKMVAQTVNKVLGARDDLKRVKALLDSASSSSDWASVASEVGCPVSEAQNLWAIISTASTQLDSPQVAELSRLDQG